jgi:fructan beta-fructosidase
MARQILFFIFALLIFENVSSQTYRALYRPQFHFSPLSGWIGDPDGMIKYDSTYHLYWWGHATSKDLVYWHEEPYPMKGDDGSFVYYSGSVVVDKENTSGFSLNQSPPFVAIYTMHQKTGGLQSQGISISSDTGQTYTYYSGNPVLDINSKEFRDPTVFWHEPTLRWIMIICSPVKHQVNLYSSPDLVTWNHLSDFGPVGAREQVWEVPDLFQLPVNGDSTNMKWIVLCGMGPNKAQYFIGDFDGTTFTMDPADQNYLTKGTGIPGLLFEDFEQTDYNGWTATGNAFGGAPVLGTLPSQTTVSGYLGQRLVNTYLSGDISTGTLTSGEFTIDKNCINFLIGGGNHPGFTCLNLLVDGTVVRTETGANSEILKWRGWDVSALKGKKAKIEIVDNYTASWGHINIDQITFSDILYNFGYEHANWVDFGSDFYAVRTYNDYDKTDTSKIWMAWMGNWEYANFVPTSWGKGFQSIPRVIELKTFNGQYKIVQKPIPALEKLRGTEVKLSDFEITGTQALDAFKPKRNTYEINTTIAFDSLAGKFGFNFCVAGNYKMVLGFDPATSNIFLDRRTSGSVSLPPAFFRIVYAPVNIQDSRLKLRIFIDQSSIEVFVNDGELVLSSLMFPETKSLGFEAFSEKGLVKLENFQAWELSSIWGILPPTGISPIYQGREGTENRFLVFPNPGKSGSEIIIKSLYENQHESVKAEIFNGMGRCINHISALEFTVPGSAIQLPLSAGIYMLRLTSGLTVESHPIVVY